MINHADASEDRFFWWENRLWREVCEECGGGAVSSNAIDKHTHCLRHRFATHLVETDANLVYIEEFWQIEVPRRQKLVIISS